MKRIIIVLAALAGAGVVLLLGAFFWSAYFEAQRADYGWSPRVTSRTYVTSPPVVLFDEGHHNASTAGFEGRYWPFGRLLRADGYDFRRGKQTFTREYLDAAQILVIANAAGGGKPVAFGINLPLPGGDDGRRGDPAFTPAEIAAVRSWVEEGGSLLLIADHAPFGAAAAGFGEVFGVTMHRGFMEVPDENSDPLLFSRENGRLGDHAILGGAGSEAIARVMTFTGQSLDGPPNATVLLRVPETAVEYVPEGDSIPARPAGRAQGLAFEYGRGRVVVLGEAAMLTAQVAKRQPFGMNQPDNDNRRFALNVMRWLSGKL
jgi:hypothetical protein